MKLPIQLDDLIESLEKGAVLFGIYEDKTKLVHAIARSTDLLCARNAGSGFRVISVSEIATYPRVDP